MKRFNLTIIIAQTSLCLALFSLGSCQKNSDATQKYYSQVNEDFEEVKNLAANRSNELFSVFNTGLNDEESKYLKFLYAYMPLSDLADYEGSFFLSQVQTALEAKAYFNWGASVPDDVFRHFVLPYRVNNENPDSSRQVFFKELKPRLKGMNMYEAVLEVNHWCHEKVEYKATDERTIAPLGIIKAAFGRCGEESTFTVTALRAVGIPARQVYTPRWAHCDDNHAWVEVWVDGDWYFIGACEPEAKLNRGWFSKPVLRAMMVHTRVFGKYKSPEISLENSEKFTKINVLDTYINPVTYCASVVNDKGEPIDSASVEFQIYNYAEFYPIAKTYTNKDGICSVQTNYGSVLVYAYKNNKYAYGIIQPESSKDSVKIVIKLTENRRIEYSDLIDIIVPIQPDIETDTNGNANNSIRLKQEDSIRNAYISSFPGKETAIELSNKTKLKSDEILNHIKLSRGNYPEIVLYFENIKDNNSKFAIALLNQISEKDHIDTDANILIDHLNNTIYTADYKDGFFENYILNPRIANEKLVAYRSFFINNIHDSLKIKIIKEPRYLVEYLNNEIFINDKLNYAGTPISPVGVYELKISDKWSFNICLVAIYRSLGIPARLEPATKTPQFYINNNWINAAFEQNKIQAIAPKAKLSFNYSGNNNLRYRIDFSIAKFNNGIFKTLDYGWETPLKEISELTLDTGYYMITTGKRLFNGNVLVKRNFINIAEDKTYNIMLEIRKAGEAFPVEGILKSELEINATTLLSWIEPGKEPTKHLIKELSSLSNEFAENNITVILFCPKSEIEAFKNKQEFNEKWELLPISEKHSFNNMIKTKQDFNDNYKPICILIDSDKNVRYMHSGYEVGLANKLLNAAKSVSE
jgi:hypothetical protein